jgi:hypothetical protein
MGHKRSLGAHARRGGGGLGSGVATSDDDHIVLRVHGSDSLPAGFYLTPGWPSISRLSQASGCFT